MAAVLVAAMGSMAGALGRISKPAKTDDDPEQRVTSAINKRPRGAQMANIRAARKARNVRRHRAQRRGAA